VTSSCHTCIGCISSLHTSSGSLVSHFDRSLEEHDLLVLNAFHHIATDSLVSHFDLLGEEHDLLVPPPYGSWSCSFEENLCPLFLPFAPHFGSKQDLSPSDLFLFSGNFDAVSPSDQPARLLSTLSSPTPVTTSSANTPQTCSFPPSPDERLLNASPTQDDITTDLPQPSEPAKVPLERSPTQRCPTCRKHFTPAQLR